jgi:hypothetical protein
VARRANHLKPVQPPCKKIFAFLLRQISCFCHAVLSRKRGRRPSSRTLGQDAVDAMASSRAFGARTNGAIAYGEVVWS